MTILTWTGGAVATALVVYLFLALLFPEKLQ